MSIIEISVGKTKYKIECPEDEKSKLMNLAQKLDDRVKNLMSGLINFDEKTLLVIAALMAEDEVEAASQLALQGGSEGKIADEDMYIAIAENIENVADYIEKLAKKIEKY